MQGGISQESWLGGLVCFIVYGDNVSGDNVSGDNVSGDNVSGDNVSVNKDNYRIHKYVDDVTLSEKIGNESQTQLQQASNSFLDRVVNRKQQKK